MGINIPEDKQGDTEWLLEQLSEKARELNMAGRLSTWSTSANYLFMNIGFEYAVQHCLGNTNESDGQMDLEMVKKIGAEVVGTDIQVGLMQNAEGKEYANYVTICGDMYVFE